MRKPSYKEIEDYENRVFNLKFPLKIHFYLPWGQ